MAIDPNQLKYLQNLAAGKTSKGGQANAGQVAWANAQLKKSGNTASTTGMSASTAKGSGNTGSSGSIPPNVLNAANSPGSNPAYGFGSGGTYGSTPGLGAAYAANKQLISTPEGRQSEIDRTLGVIANRQAAGMDTTEQMNYLTRNLDYQQPQQNVGSIPRDAVYSARSESELNQLAQDQTAIDRAALLNAINTQRTALQNSMNYANQLVQDNRVLSDQAFNRTNNPFSGGTDYRAAMVQRGRDIDDKARMDDLANRMAALDQEIANFDKLTPERIRQIQNEYLQLEREFALRQSDVTGLYGGNQTLAARTADQNYGLNYAGMFGTLPGNGYGASVYRTDTGAPMTLAAQNQQWGQQFDREQFEFQKAQQEWQNMFNQAQFDEEKAARIWEQAFKEKSFAQSVKDEAASRGLQWASLNQRQKEFIADQTFREKQFQLDLDKFNASQNQSGQVSYENNPNYGLEVAQLEQDPQASYNDYVANPQEYIAAYGPEGYQRLLDRARQLLDY